MSRRLAAVAAVVAAAAASVVLPAPAPAAAQAGGELAVTAVDVAGFPRVTATVGVPPALAGRAVPLAAFAVTEGGSPVYAAVTPLPPEHHEVVLVIDTSGSMAGAPLAAAKRSAASFLATMPATTRVAVVGFGASATLASGFSLDRQALATAVNSLVATGETALYDAMTMAVAQFSPTVGVARSIVLLSDGGDTASGVDLDTAVGSVAAGRARVDVVELASSESNTAALARLAGAAGGRLVPAGDPAALDAIYRDIATTLANQYRVSYRSESTGRTELEVSIDHAGVTASARAAVHPPAPSSTPGTPAGPGPGAGDSARADGGGGARLVLGLGAFFAAFCLAGLVLFRPRLPGGRRARWRLALGARRSATPSALTGLADRATQVADAALERRGRHGRLNTALERAGVALRPGEFLVLCGCAALVAMLLGLLLSGAVAGLAVAALVLAGSRAGIGVVASRRQARFATQLSDTLQLMSGTLRAGYGLLQALDAMAREAPAPTNEEFRRIVVEARLGRDLSESLRAMSERMGSQDFQWVVEAIEINREVGGDLAEVLDRVGATIRERDFLRRQVKSLSAEGRLSGYLLMALPGALCVMIKMRNPSYFAELTHGPGLLLSGFGVVLLVVGGLWLRKVCRIAF